MRKIKITMIDTYELFSFAEKNFRIQWNPCNDLFFRSEVDKYKNYTEFELGEPLEYISSESDNKDYTGDDLAYWIINEFMVQNKLKSIMINTN